MAAFPSHFQYSPESDLLTKALTSDQFAVESTIEQLSSAYPGIRQRMLEAVHNCADERIWVHLLNCFALGRWSVDQSLDIYDVPAESQRLNVSIVDAFVEDHSEEESKRKSTLLSLIMDSDEDMLCEAAAYLSGLRGNIAALPILEKVLESGDQHWQLRSVQALSAIEDKKSAELLIHILIRHHEQFHQEARRSLAELGGLAEAAWIDALNNPDPHIRWHAARGLAEIGNTSALQIVAQGLCNDNKTVRWVSSDLLARIGPKAIPDVLKVICDSPLSDECRQSAFHALRAIKSYRANECLKPLVSALSSSSTKQIAQTIAGRMLNDWTRLDGYISGRTPSIQSNN